jgi:Uma2 family endonuclease
VAGDYRTAAPTHAALVVEIAESGLRLDRTRKSSIYARAGITDYWILNLIDGLLEVRRDPMAAPRRPRVYRSVRTLDRGTAIEPLAAPGRRIPVSDLLG